MPLAWLKVLAHPATKDKASLLMKLKYEMTIDDVYDLIEYQEYESMVAYEDYKKQNMDRY